MAFDSNPGSSKLAEVLVGRIRKEGESPQVIDFGTITAGWGLQPDSFKAVIPNGSYTVLRHLKLGKSGEEMTVTKMDSEAGDDGESEGDAQPVPPHEHSVPVPDGLQGLQAGDRVLLVWVQNEAVVIGIL